MRNKSRLLGAATVSVLAAVLCAGAALNAVAQDVAVPSAPQYSETCAHGHNGFDCKPSTIRADLDSLEERVSALEAKVSAPP